MLVFYWKMQYTKSVNTIVCIHDLVIMKYFGNNTTEIKRIVYIPGSTTILYRCCVGTDSCVSYGMHSFDIEEF